MHFTLVSVVAFAAAVAAQGCVQTQGISPRQARRVQRKFAAADIAPGILRPFTPKVSVGVEYPDTPVDLGTEIPTTGELHPSNSASVKQSEHPPTNLYASSDPGTTMEPVITFTKEPGFNARKTNYTVLMFDPDAPSPDLPLLRSFLHLIKYNERPSCFAGSTANSQTTAFYMLPTPLSIPVHRYIFLILRQPEGAFTPVVDPVVLVSRGMFEVRKFIKENSLTVVGGNYFVQGLESLAPES